MSHKKFVKIKIENEITVLPEEIYTSKVIPSGNGAIISSFKRFIGKDATIIISDKIKPLQKNEWLLTEEDLLLLREETNKIVFDNPYAKQRKEKLIDSINFILKHPKDFDLDYLIEIIEEMYDRKEISLPAKKIMLKIKKSYPHLF